MDLDKPNDANATSLPTVSSAQAPVERRRKRPEMNISLRKKKNENKETPVLHGIPILSTMSKINNCLDDLLPIEFQNSDQLAMLSNARLWVTGDIPELQLKGIRCFIRLISESSSENLHASIALVIQTNVIPECIKFLRNGPPELLNATLWLLINVSAGNESQTDYLILTGAIQPIISLLPSADAVTIDLAVWVLGNCMADDSKRCNRLLHMRVIPALVDIIRRFIDNIQVMKILAFALNNATRFDKSIHNVQMTPFETMQCLSAIQSLLLVEDVDVQEYALRALRNISCGGVDKIDLINKTGFVPLLVHLLDSQDIKIVHLTTTNVGNIAFGSDAQTEVLLDFGIVPTLLKLLDSSDKELVQEAAWILSNIAAGTDSQVKDLIESGGLTKVVNLLEADEQTMAIKKECLWTIAHLSSNDGIKKAPKLFVKLLFDLKAIEIITIHLTLKDNGVIEVALRALENILRLGRKKSALLSFITSKMQVAGAVDEIQNLAYHVQNKISKIAMSILDNSSVYSYELIEKKTSSEMNSIAEYLERNNYDLW